MARSFDYWVKGESYAFSGGKVCEGPYSSRSEALGHSRFKDRVVRVRRGSEPRGCET